MAVIPGVRYAKNDDLLLAYQVVGTGPRDLVYLQFETPTIVGHWLLPENARYLERLASFSRLILTDRRGMGCSDPLPPGESPTLEDLVEDLLTIMEDAYVTRPVLMGGFESAFIAMMAAATHPDRFDGLILFSPAPSWRRSDELPWERTEDELQHELGVIRKATDLHAWAEQYARALVPSRAGDPQMVSILQAMSALSGTPEAWYWDQRMFNGVDLLDLLPTIRIPRSCFRDLTPGTRAGRTIGAHASSPSGSRVRSTWNCRVATARRGMASPNSCSPRSVNS